MHDQFPALCSAAACDVDDRLPLRAHACSNDPVPFLVAYITTKRDVEVQIFCLRKMERSLLVAVRPWHLSRTQLYGIILSSMLAWILGTSGSQQDHHDGQTVSLMLAKFGEGPLALERRRQQVYDAGIDCEHQDSCSDNSTLNLTVEDAGSIENSVGNLCWGYERNCTKANRLFIPQCHGPPQPWYVLVCTKQYTQKTPFIESCWYDLPLFVSHFSIILIFLHHVVCITLQKPLQYCNQN